MQRPYQNIHSNLLESVRGVLRKEYLGEVKNIKKSKLLKQIKDGDVEAENDVEVGKLITVRNTDTNNRYMVRVTEEIELDERELTDDEKAAKEKNVKDLKKHKSDFEKRYGDDAESVMHAVATKRAKNESLDEDFDWLEEAGIGSEGLEMSLVNLGFKKNRNYGTFFKTLIPNTPNTIEAEIDNGNIIMTVNVQANLIKPIDGEIKKAVREIEAAAKKILR